MAEYIGEGLRAWDNNGVAPGAAAPLTVNIAKSAHGVIPGDDRANLMRLWITISVVGLDAINVQVFPARRNTTTTVNFAALPVINSVAGGVVNMGQGTFTLAFAAPFVGTAMIEIPISPGIPYEVGLSRTGGGAGTLAIAVADLLAV
jgi:hypothetical protein